LTRPSRTLSALTWQRVARSETTRAVGDALMRLPAPTLRDASQPPLMPAVPLLSTTLYAMEATAETT